jgi:hypothetical protein
MPGWAPVAAALLALGWGGAAAGPVYLDVPAPALTGGPWLNTGTSKPLTLASRKGKVTVVHFWTFG